MTQENQKQLIVPFGKYKGKPVERLLQDESYSKWLTGQDWFQEKFQSMYTLIIHNYHSQPLDTPEHNKMQIKFLDEVHALKLAFLVSDQKLFQFDNSSFKKIVPLFLSDLKKHGVDLDEIYKQLEKMKGKNLLEFSKIEFEQKGLDVKYHLSYGFSDFAISESTFRKAPSVFNNFLNNSTQIKFKVELKPLIGDDFPTVLRQMKTSGASILVIQEYRGTGVSFDEFKKFFHTQGMKVLTEKEIEQVHLPSYDKSLIFDDSIYSI